MHSKYSKNAIGQLAHEIAGTAKEMARTSPIIMGLVESGALATHINAFWIKIVRCGTIVDPR